MWDVRRSAPDKRVYIVLEQSLFVKMNFMHFFRVETAGEGAATDRGTEDSRSFREAADVFHVGARGALPKRSNVSGLLGRVCCVTCCGLKSSDFVFNRLSAWGRKYIDIQNVRVRQARVEGACSEVGRSWSLDGLDSRYHCLCI